MERDAFSLATQNVEPAPGETTAPLPTLEVHYEGPESDLRSALASPGSEGTDPEFDVSFRFTDDADVTKADGVLAVADRLTGEFVCECDVEADRIFAFLAAAKRRAASLDGSPTFRIQFLVEDTPIRTEELDTFLVYANSGRLRESKSLLPNGVQL